MLFNLQEISLLKLLLFWLWEFSDVGKAGLLSLETGNRLLNEWPFRSTVQFWGFVLMIWPGFHSHHALGQGSGVHFMYQSTGQKIMILKLCYFSSPFLVWIGANTLQRNWREWSLLKFIFSFFIQSISWILLGGRDAGGRGEGYTEPKNLSSLLKLSMKLWP